MHEIRMNDSYAPAENDLHPGRRTPADALCLPLTYGKLTNFSFIMTSGGCWLKFLFIYTDVYMNTLHPKVRTTLHLITLLAVVVALGALVLAMARPDVAQDRLHLLTLVGGLVAAGVGGLLLVMQQQEIRELRIMKATSTQQREKLRTKLETDLRLEKAQTQYLLDTMAEAAVIYNDRTILYANDAFAKLSGYPLEDVIGRSFDNNPPAILRDLSHLRERITVTKGWQGQARLQRRDSRSLEALVIGMQMENPSRSLVLLRENWEKKLQVQKTNFISNTSHELRTPLANIKTRLYLLRRKREQFEEHMQVMETTVEYMQSLLEEMLDVSRFERGVMHLNREPVQLQDLVEETVKRHQSRAEHRGIELRLQAPEDELELSADEKRISQVVNNLILNAMNHTQQDGRVEVSLTRTPENMAELQVKDDGVSLPPEMLEQVFQPFSTASQGAVSGTVLGLTLAKEIVQLHGGVIEVESQVDKGTVYTVLLPLEVDPPLNPALLKLAAERT
jgi:PAS domain S-box-containing protein